MITLLAAAAAWGQDGDGIRINGLGEGGLVTLRQAAVVGADGGLMVFTGRAQAALDRLRIGVQLPIAVFGLGDRRTGLGNIGVDVLHAIPGDKVHAYMGISGHAAVGRAYTWVNETEEIWPGTGVEVVLQLERPGNTALLARFSGGPHLTGGFDPIPVVYGKGALSLGLDQTISGPFGLVLEVSGGWWDVSPLDAGAVLRLGDRSGLRLRAGAVIPVATWAGLHPTGAPPGVREATLLVDLTVGS